MEQNQQTTELQQNQLKPPIVQKKFYSGQNFSAIAAAFGVIIFLFGLIFGIATISEAKDNMKELIIPYGVIIIAISLVGALLLGLLSAIVNNLIELRKEMESYFKKNS
jgi:hypothetical protein